MKNKITALIADERGNIFDEPAAEGVGRVGKEFFKLKPEDLIKLPDSADLMFLPARRAVGYRRGEFVTLKGFAVSAILPQGYTRTHLPAFRRTKDAQILPLYGYTAVVVYKDELHAAALYTDENHKWDPQHYNTPALRKLIRRVKHDLPENRIVAQVANCSLKWHCLRAEFVLRALGMRRADFADVQRELLGLYLLASRRVLSEPAEQNHLQADRRRNRCRRDLSPFARRGRDYQFRARLRRRTEPSSRHNLRGDKKNPCDDFARTNQYQHQRGIKKIVDAGLDSMRVSIISANAENYQRYYRAGYKLAAVKDSIRYALDNGVHVSLNMLYMPGFNDRQSELDAWKNFLDALPAQMIQVRNLNYDPDEFFRVMPADKNFVGVKNFLRELETTFPALTVGNFSHYVRN